jgi:hypothetical protein
MDQRRDRRQVEGRPVPAVVRKKAGKTAGETREKPQHGQAPARGGGAPVISVREILSGIVPMFEGQVQDPKVFIAALRQYHEADEKARGELANALSDLIITKRIDLAEVRHGLLDTGQTDLIETLDRLIDLIEPYIEEGGVDE